VEDCEPTSKTCRSVPRHNPKTASARPPPWGRFFDTRGCSAGLARALAPIGRHMNKPDIYRRISWRALTELCSPSLLTEQRERFEARILGGEDVKAAEIGRARVRLPSGRPRNSAGQRALRMAA
jgi:hypothetical protein